MALHHHWNFQCKFLKFWNLSRIEFLSTVLIFLRLLMCTWVFSVMSSIYLEMLVITFQLISIYVLLHFLMNLSRWPDRRTVLWSRTWSRTMIARTAIDWTRWLITRLMIIWSKIFIKINIYILLFLGWLAVEPVRWVESEIAALIRDKDCRPDDQLIDF